jgi:hypothetical protein
MNDDLPGRSALPRAGSDGPAADGACACGGAAAGDAAALLVLALVLALLPLVPALPLLRSGSRGPMPPPRPPRPLPPPMPAGAAPLAPVEPLGPPCASSRSEDAAGASAAPESRSLRGGAMLNQQERRRLLLGGASPVVSVGPTVSVSSAAARPVERSAACEVSSYSTRTAVATHRRRHGCLRTNCCAPIGGITGTRKPCDARRVPHAAWWGCPMHLVLQRPRAMPPCPPTPREHRTFNYCSLIHG